MKRLFFILTALICTMSINAQMVEIYSGDQLVSKHRIPNNGKVVFKKTPDLGITGTAKRTGEIEVNWVQLWDGGPRFAEYNVGAANNKAEDYGGYYCFGKTIDKDKNATYYNGNMSLAGDDDTATKLWGGNWRMPTKEEFEALVNNENCTCTWTTQKNVTGLLCTGKEGTAFADNSVFLPASSYCYMGSVGDQGDSGSYWTSTSGDDGKGACFLDFTSGHQNVDYEWRYLGFPVRAVLNE